MMSKVLRRIASPTGTPQKQASTTKPGSSRPANAPGVAPPHDDHHATSVMAPTVDSSFVGVTVDYNPSLDGDADPGEVVWTWVPWEEDPTQGKDRPIVIVGRRGRLLVGVPLTSKEHDREPQVPVGTGPWDREGRPSFAKLDRVLDVDPSQVRREGSILDRGHFDQIVAALRSRR
jgi:hypothetical protein